MIEETIRNMVKNSTDLPVINGKAFQVEGDYITIQQLTGARNYSHSGLEKPVSALYQISTWCDTLIDAKIESRKAINMSTIEPIKHYFIRNENETYSHDKEKYGCIIDVEFNYKEE